MVIMTINKRIAVQTSFQKFDNNRFFVRFTTINIIRLLHETPVSSLHADQPTVNASLQMCYFVYGTATTATSLRLLNQASTAHCV
jgi:hypothetical protein